MDKLCDVIKEEILSEMDSVQTMDLGSEEHVKTVKAVCELANTVKEMETKAAELEVKKIQSENDKKFKELELKLKEEQAASERKHFWVTLVTSLGTGIVSFVAHDRTKKWFIKTEYDFEGIKHGIHSTNIGRTGINKIIGDIFRK